MRHLLHVEHMAKHENKQEFVEFRLALAASVFANED